MMTMISQTVQLPLFSVIGDRLNEGGPLFMYTTLITLLIILVLIIKEFIQNKDREKTIRLVSSISLFTLVWGFLGQIIGLMGALDAIESFNDNIAPNILASGLKISILSPMFGMIVFLIARIGILALIITKKE